MTAEKRKQVHYIPSRFQKRRFRTAWTVMIACLVLLIAFAGFNYNAVMILFERGNVRLGSLDNLTWKLQLSPDEYELLDETTGDDGVTNLAFRTTDGLAEITAAAADGKLVFVSGTIHTRMLGGSGAVRSLLTINDILSPIIYSRDILAFELFVLQEAYRLPDFTNGLNITKDLGETAMALTFSRAESKLDFQIYKK